jgi:hypothetical protein
VNENKLCMIHPDGYFKKVWNIVLTWLLIYTATVMPYRMAFIKTEFLGPWFIAELIIDFLFFCDVVFN